jgi:hypothetical protein
MSETHSFAYTGAQTARLQSSVENLRITIVCSLNRAHGARLRSPAPTSALAPAVELHINDVALPTIARAILLLRLAAAGRLNDTVSLWCNALISPEQRAALDTAIDECVSHASSVRTCNGARSSSGMRTHEQVGAGAGHDSG